MATFLIKSQLYEAFFKVDLTKYQFLHGVGVSAEPLGPRGVSVRRTRPLGRETTGTLRRLREELYGRPQQNADFPNKVLTLRGVFEGRSHEVSIFTRCWSARRTLVSRGVSIRRPRPLGRITTGTLRKLQEKLK